MRLYRYIVPGLVIQAVLVGGGYATGRELVEFFLARGPRTALAGLALTALWFSAGSMVAFELARRYRAFDYKSFCRIFLGRFWVLFEIGYYALLLLVLSVLSAAPGSFWRNCSACRSSSTRSCSWRWWHSLSSSATK